ncbi:MAG: VWA domain-containing protein [Syntrophobacteraceae bacterium]
MVITDSVPPDIEEINVDTRLAYQLPRQRFPWVHTAVGKREQRVYSSLRGKYSRSRFPRGNAGDIALDATLRAAAARVSKSGAKLNVRTEDLRVKLRKHRSPYLITFVVDNSWSMHVEKNLAKTKGVVLALLKDARIYHDKVAMVAFRHNRMPDATVCLPLTTSYTLAAERLRKLALSGTTPLPDAIRKAYGLLRQEVSKYRNAIPVMVIITDGLPNIPLKPGGDPYEDISLLCRHLKREGISTIVVDTEPKGSEAAGSNCREMAELAGGVYLPFSRFTPLSIQSALDQRKEMPSAG